MNGRSFKWIAAGFIGVILTIAFLPALGTFSQPVTAIDPLVKANILNTTVQIKLFAPAPGVQPDGTAPDNKIKNYVMAQGLGTLVTWQGEPVIVTHNHWGEMLKDAEYVRIHDAQGNQLLELAINEFTSLIRYSDPGTLVLNAPAGLSLTRANLGGEPSVTAGDIVTVAHQNPENSNRVDLLQARVVSYKKYQGQTVFQLAVLDEGPLIPGDSGGGIWLYGELVGNTWAAVEKTVKLPISTETGLAAPLPVSYFQNNAVK